MRLSEIPFGSRAGLLVRCVVGGAASEIGTLAIVELERGPDWLNMNVGAGGYVGCSAERWEVVPVAELGLGHAFEISKQETRSAMDGFLLALNAVRKANAKRGDVPAGR